MFDCLYENANIYCTENMEFPRKELRHWIKPYVENKAASIFYHKYLALIYGLETQNHNVHNLK